MQLTSTSTSGYTATVREEPTLLADLWFYWDSDQPSLEIQLLTIGGTIAGSYPKLVTKGERLPIHRKYLRSGVPTVWYVRVVGSAEEVKGLSIALELTDRVGRRVRALPICESDVLRPRRVAQIERALLVPDSLEPLS